MAKSKVQSEQGKATGHQEFEPGGDNVRLGDLAPGIIRWAGGGGAVGLLGAVGLGAAAGDGFRHFMHSYLVAFTFVLAIALGALWWVILQHLVNAEWSIVLRRVGELLSAGLPLLALLALPIVLPPLFGNSSLFPWADAAFMSASASLVKKQAYLNGGFFAGRCLIYLFFWSALSIWLLRRSRTHDRTGDQKLLDGMRTAAAPAMIAYALTVTFASIDLIMTLDPNWYSTIFGVYYFAGCVLAQHATLALTLLFLQRRGRLTRSVTVHHLHDVGKMMFAFVVFWSYIAFSQFMLIWYANLPEETTFYQVRARGSWAAISVALVLGQFVLPFLGLISRHVKRHRAGLAFWSAWLLAFGYLHLYWLIMPNFAPDELPFSLLDLTTLVGMLGLYLAFVAWQARAHSLVPRRDPRLAKSLAFEIV